MLGVVIGVGAVIAMIAVGNGASRQMERAIASMGSNILILRPAPANVSGVRGAIRPTLTMADVMVIEDECWSVRSVAPQVDVNAQLVFENRNWPTRVFGSTPSFFRHPRISAQ